MKRSFSFSLAKAIPAAWDFLWAINLKQRAKEEKEHPDGNFGKYARRWYTRTFYICAADVVRQVRSFAYETAHGLEWGVNGVRGPDYGIRLHGDVEAEVRRWLLRTKEGHNFGRGHISGMRFRPPGEPLGPSEKDTIEEKAKPKRPRPIHFSRHGYSGRPLCVAVQNEGHRMGWRPSKASTTNRWTDGPADWQKGVTCPRCLNLRGHRLAQSIKQEA